MTQRRQFDGPGPGGGPGSVSSGDSTPDSGRSDSGTAADGPGPRPTAPDHPGSGQQSQQDKTGRRNTGDPGLRALIGAGRSRLPPGTAMRARDIARPDPDDLAEAERSVVIRRRPWTDPTATTPRGQRRR
ncbi:MULTISPECIES: hypothetical protein [Protofrankia]|uniref:Uncharacterized protein n=1 Tax=Candidatus Protofrankia datiscae TaxID=2716812 RepID=F8B3E5_9ACTN|nr:MULTISPECIES: hypothetical protein [Protofrankia]AEH08962.1 hypothetical protein FsymDg_1501 [Candidatus Protofrankia datiscae]